MNNELNSATQAQAMPEVPRYDLVESSYGSGYMVHWDKALELDPAGEWCKYADVVAAAPPSPQPVAHELYTDADKDRPNVICDTNGQVVLGLCKNCGKGECELVEPCAPRRTAAIKSADLDDYPQPVKNVYAHLCASAKYPMATALLDSLVLWTNEIRRAATPAAALQPVARQDEAYGVVAWVRTDRPLTWCSFVTNAGKEKLAKIGEASEYSTPLYRIAPAIEPVAGLTDAEDASRADEDWFFSPND